MDGCKWIGLDDENGLDNYLSYPFIESVIVETVGHVWLHPKRYGLVAIITYISSTLFCISEEVKMT